MRTYHRLFVITPLLLLIQLSGFAYGTPRDSVSTSGSPSPWEFSVAGYYYMFPSDEDIPMAIVRADRGKLHIEARYNYEDRRTASAFAGFNFLSGDAFTVELTPMAGVAFGSVTGIIPALEVSLGYGAFDFYAEGEYLIDLSDKSGNFAYTWLELGVMPTDVFRTGLAAQRTRVFESPLEIDRGLFAQAIVNPATLSLYGFNLFTDSWFLVIGLEVGW